MKYLFSGLEANTYFSLFQERDKDLYYELKKTLLGDRLLFSIAITRETKHLFVVASRVNVFGEADANALYLWALAQKMPTGYYVRRRKENDFKKYFNKLSVEWSDYVAYRDSVNIVHNHGERIGRYLVDGFDSANQTIYEYNGCYFHGFKWQIWRAYVSALRTNDTTKKVFRRTRI